MGQFDKKKNIVKFYHDKEQLDYDMWANIYSEDPYLYGFNSYFDYFFSGQDIKISIEGLESNDFLPVYQFGYNIQQNKQPVYGFWSYTYDAMMRGTRIVSGAFSIITPSPDFMLRKVAKAAEARAAILTQYGRYFDVLHPIRGFEEDEKNIDKYWRKNYDSNLSANQQHLFSVHPPFNFLITYGVQDISMANLNPDPKVGRFRERYGDSNAMMLDTNERIVEVDPEMGRMKLLIENVELVSRQVEIDAEGNPLIETYAFMARDVIESPDYTPSGSRTSKANNSL